MKIVYASDSTQQKFSPFVNKILRDLGATIPHDNSCRILFYVREYTGTRVPTDNDDPTFMDKTKSYTNDHLIVSLAFKKIVLNDNFRFPENLKTNKPIFFFNYQDTSPNLLWLYGPITVNNSKQSIDLLRKHISSSEIKSTYCNNPSTSTGTLKTEYPKQPVKMMEIPVLGVAAVVLAVASSVFAT